MWGNKMDYVILAEDEPEMRKLIKLYLSPSGENYMIIEAADGKQAIDSLEERVKAGGKGVVVTDINMPLADGWQVLAYMKKNHSEIPVIMMSMYIDNQTAAEQLGAFAFLYKANHNFKSELLEIVKNAFEKQRDST
jgi:DNA-binding NtrC family response regulator